MKYYSNKYYEKAYLHIVYNENKLLQLPYLKNVSFFDKYFILKNNFTLILSLYQFLDDSLPSIDKVSLKIINFQNAIMNIGNSY